MTEPDEEHVHDRERTSPGSYYEHEDVSGDYGTDADDELITQQRDLEDFAHLQVFVDPKLYQHAFDTSSGGETAIGQIQVSYFLELEDGDGTLVNLFYATSKSPNGHVSNKSNASVQASDAFFRSAAATSLGESQLEQITEGINRYLFEANGTGLTTPTLTFVTQIQYPDGTTTEKRHAIELTLRDFEDFYDQYSVPFTNAERKQVDFTSINDAHFADAQLLHSSAVHGSAFFDSEENVVLVHGWNMSDEWKTAFSETAFKRLYWQGFAGRFVAFDWPTYYDGEGPLWPEALNQTYNASEYVAYRSGHALKQLFSSLGENTHVLAHSMGNVVVGEALRQWRQDPNVNTTPAVKTYVAMQAAVSSGAYGKDRPDFFNYYNDNDRYGNFDSNPSSNIPYFLAIGVDESATAASNHSLVSGADAVKWVNMYNPQDVATGDAWVVNNDLKTSFVQNVAHWPYIYDYSVLSIPNSEGYYRFNGTRILPQNSVNIGLGLHQFDNPNVPGPHAYEILAFLSQASHKTVGTIDVPWWFHVNTSIEGGPMLVKAARLGIERTTHFNSITTRLQLHPSGVI